MNKYRIIIIENDADERLFIQEGFDEAGLFEITALLENGDALLAWLANNPDAIPDLVLSDLNMPGRNGYDVITDLKERPVYARIPVIIMSTSSTPTIISKCLEQGASDYLVKPDTFIEYAAFAMSLFELLEKKYTRRANQLVRHEK